MKTYLECVPCFVRQAIDGTRISGGNEADQEAVLRETLRMVADMPFTRPPAWMGQRIYAMLRERTGHVDPYAEVKRTCNQMALRVRPKLEQEIADAPDPFEMAVRFAIAGNVIDFGVGKAVGEEQLLQSLEDAARQSMNGADIRELREAAERAGDILYLCDNAGEIVLDRLLLQRLPTDRVTAVVRGGPIINDATMEDAEEADLTDIVTVIDNGADAPGTVVELCSEEFRARLQASDLVISKGQGNYESLSKIENETFFLLKAKCHVVAEDIGCPVGDIVVRHKPKTPPKEPTP